MACKTDVASDSVSDSDASDNTADHPCEVQPISCGGKRKASDDRIVRESTTRKRVCGSDNGAIVDPMKISGDAKKVPNRNGKPLGRSAFYAMWAERLPFIKVGKIRDEMFAIFVLDYMNIALHLQFAG